MSSELITESDDKQDSRIRLLICNSCNSIQPLPMYQGPADRDDTLNARLAEHRFPDGNEHFGALATVSEKSWDDPEKRKGILAEMANARGAGQGEGFGQEFYDVKSTFKEDAYYCWAREHNRTTDCGDYKSGKKRLLADTRADRRELGLDQKSRASTFLCDFCVYKSGVVQKKAMKKAGY